MLFWLCGWVAGLVFAVSTLFRQNNANNPPEAFLAAWLVMWIFGGLFTIYFVYRILRSNEPEVIGLTDESIFYDPGTISPIAMMLPFHASFRTNPFAAFVSLFGKRQVRSIERQSFNGFVFESGNAVHRLYFDDGADRVVIGEYLREPDREWLASELSNWMKK